MHGKAVPLFAQVNEIVRAVLLQRQMSHPHEGWGAKERKRAHALLNRKTPFGHFSKRLKRNDCGVNTVKMRGCWDTVTQPRMLLLAESLANNSVVKKVDFSMVGCGDDLLTPWCFSTFRSNVTIMELNLSRCNLERGAVAALSRALATNKNQVLTKLVLSDNKIQGPCIYELLKHNNTLETLDLSGNNVDDNSAKLIADGLVENSSLLRLDVSSNPIGVDGATSLLHALCPPTGASTRSNLSLRRLYIGSKVSDGDTFVLSAQGDTQLQRLYRNISFYTAANRAGRMALMVDNLQTQLWPHLLSQASQIGGPSMVYFFLINHPVLVKRSGV